MLENDRGITGLVFFDPRAKGPGSLAIVIFFIIHYTEKYSPKSYAKNFRTKCLCQSRWKNFFVTFLHLSSFYLLICWTYRLDNCVKFESSPGGKTEMAFEDKSLRGQKKAYSVKCKTYQMKAFFELIFHRMSSVNVSVRVNFLEINKPEKTEDISWHHFWSPCAKSVTFEERLQKFQTDDAYFWQQSDKRPRFG